MRIKLVLLCVSLFGVIDYKASIVDAIGATAKGAAGVFSVATSNPAKAAAVGFLAYCASKEVQRVTEEKNAGRKPGSQKSSVAIIVGQLKKVNIFEAEKHLSLSPTEKKALENDSGYVDAPSRGPGKALSRPPNRRSNSPLKEEYSSQTFESRASDSAPPIQGQDYKKARRVAPNTAGNLALQAFGLQTQKDTDNMPIIDSEANSRVPTDPRIQAEKDELALYEAEIQKIQKKQNQLDDIKRQYLQDDPNHLECSGEIVKAYEDGLLALLANEELVKLAYNTSGYTELLDELTQDYLKDHLKLKQETHTRLQMLPNTLYRPHLATYKTHQTKLEKARSEFIQASKLIAPLEQFDTLLEQVSEFLSGTMSWLGQLLPFLSSKTPDQDETIRQLADLHQADGLCMTGHEILKELLQNQSIDKNKKLREYRDINLKLKDARQREINEQSAKLSKAYEDGKTFFAEKNFDIDYLAQYTLIQRGLYKIKIDLQADLNLTFNNRSKFDSLQAQKQNLLEQATTLEQKYLECNIKLCFDQKNDKEDQLAYIRYEPGLRAKTEEDAKRKQNWAGEFEKLNRSQALRLNLNKNNDIAYDLISETHNKYKAVYAKYEAAYKAIIESNNNKNNNKDEALAARYKFQPDDKLILLTIVKDLYDEAVRRDTQAKSGTQSAPGSGARGASSGSMFSRGLRVISGFGSGKSSSASGAGPKSQAAQSTAPAQAISAYNKAIQDLLNNNLQKDDLTQILLAYAPARKPGKLIIETDLSLDLSTQQLKGTDIILGDRYRFTGNNVLILVSDAEKVSGTPIPSDKRA